MRAFTRSLAAFTLVVALATYGQLTPSAGAATRTVGGTVESAGTPLPGYEVTLFAAGSSAPVALGTTTTAADGSFSISYEEPVDPDAVLYLRAESGELSLWSVLGAAPVPDTAVVTEATTVATAYAMAQFTDGATISGPAPGLPNAAMMFTNLADAETGTPSGVLSDIANTGTRTLRTFDSLANIVTACLESAADCQTLFNAATSPEGSRPDDTFEAMVNVAHDPWFQITDLFAVSQLGSMPYQPTLLVSPPGGWTLAVRFVGDNSSLDGPGNIVVDHRGHLWVNNNYTYDSSHLADVCAGNELFEFLPDGSFAPGSPYTGGGLSGAGFGIGRDPYGDIWVGNFGFSSPNCVTGLPPANSISQFHPDGTAVSPDGTGWTQGNIASPQATLSDDRGNIWVANCANDSVTVFPDGDPDQALNIADLGLRQPFGIAFNNDGIAFVTGSANNTVAMIGPDFAPLPGSPITGDFLSTPMGLAADSAGNMWIPNQGVAAPFCPDLEPDPGAPSIALLGPDGSPAPGTPFTGGGIRLPWGIAIDGNDNVWVADFGGERTSQFCGVPAIDCRPGTTTGAAISPDVEGYRFDGLTRNTGLAIDPSGNVWLMNNWIQTPDVNHNPGAFQIVAFVGMAGPVQPAAPRPRPVETPAPVAPTSPLAPATATTPRFTG